MMRIRWTEQARSDLVRLHEFLAPVDPRAAARIVRSLRQTPSRVLPDNPRLGARLPHFAPREVRRLFVDDYEVRYELRSDMIVLIGIWHTREDR
jgi:plasmid stabilization system protein ParE